MPLNELQPGIDHAPQRRWQQMGKASQLTWRRSSHSTSGENCVEVAAPSPGAEVRDSEEPGDTRPDLSQAPWTKSTRSQQTTDQCVELAGVSGYAAIRDSKDPNGPRLVLNATAWATFISQIKSGTHDRA
jgi:hypothetical protein